MKNGPSHTVPQLILFAASLPQLGPGKVDKREVGLRLQGACDARIT